MRNILIILLVFMVQGCGQAEDLSRKEEIKKLPAAYQALGEGCLTRGSFNCCMSSVRQMANGKYIEAGAPKDGAYQCPDGYTGNMLKCESTYVWCEPKKEDRT